MVPTSPVTLRVKFKKVGDLAYISHLDLVRTMMKILVRAHLPLYYSEGFNPKPRLAFAAPLSLGTESLCEYMDIRLCERISESEAVEALNRNMTEDMQATLAYYPETKFTSLKWMSYKITVKTAGADAALAEAVDKVLSREVIEIERKTKKGELVTVDVAPLVRSASCVFDGEHLVINATLSAAPESFLNPEKLITLLRRECGILTDPVLVNEYYSILRLAAYKEDMSEFL